MSLRSPTTCSYVSEATSFAMRHCTIAASPLPMYSEPDSFRSRHFIINQHTGSGFLARIHHRSAPECAASVPHPQYISTTQG